MPPRRLLPQFLPWATLASAPAFAFLVLRTRQEFDFLATTPEALFYTVSAVAAIAAATALVVAVAAARAGSLQRELLGVGLFCMAGLAGVQGLSTPGFIVPADGASLGGLSARLAIVIGAALAAGSAVMLSRGDAASGRLRAGVLGVPVGLLAVYATVALRWPGVLPDGEATPLGGLLVVLGVGLAAFAVYRYGREYRRTGRLTLAAVALGAVLIAQASLGMQFSEESGASSWVNQSALLLGFVYMLWGLLVEDTLTRFAARADGAALEAAVADLRAGYTESIINLTAAMEAKDGFTVGHGERVASLSVVMGQQLGLAPERLRALAQGAMLSDVGKVGIPDRILHKEGALSAEEMDIVRRHPLRGGGMLSPAVTGAIELAIIRHHHERYDGTGYPDGLTGEQIPFEARIVGVADVYNALRSPRAHRPAWVAELAQQHVREGAGAHFDPQCVRAFLAIVDRWEEQHGPSSIAGGGTRSAA